MLRPRPLALATLAALLCATAAPPARAQSDKAGAEALLTEGLKLFAAKDYASACPKIEESLRLFSSVNTEYHLADCYEHLGRMATAWVDFLEVADRAHAAGEAAKESKARERAGALERQLGHLVIEVSDAALAGLKIERDGSEVGKAQWGTAMPVDPGEHVVTATAPDHTPLTLKVTTTNGASSKLTVPALEAAPAPPVAPAAPPVAPAAPPPAPPDGYGDGQRLLGWIVGGAGVAGLATGIVVGLVAKSSYSGAAGCSATVCQTQSGLDQRNSAQSTGDVATAIFIGGGVAAAAGVVIWLTAPRTSAAVGFAPAPGGVVAAGRF